MNIYNHSIYSVQQGIPSTQPHVPVNPGYNRPIPQQDMKTIEKQLVHHIDFERNKKKVEEEILQLDPWDISSRKLMSDSVQSNSSDLFYSFDLNTTDESSRGLEPPHPPSGRLTKGAKCRNNPDMANIQLGDGVGLQQLSPSSSPFSPIKGVHRSRSSFAHAPQTQTVISNEEVVCKYSCSLSGLTCAILESNPVHTYMNNPTGKSYDKQETKTGSNTDPDSLSSSPEYCSLDEGGLNPYKYFDCVENILKGRVGRREVQSCRDQLGKVLPADHLL